MTTCKTYTIGTTYRFGYQGQFAEYDFETGYNHFEARLYNPRIGRWMTTDLAGQYWSPYLAMGNNWMNSVDSNGMYSPDDFVFGANGEFTGQFIERSWFFEFIHGGHRGIQVDANNNITFSFRFTDQRYADNITNSVLNNKGTAIKRFRIITNNEIDAIIANSGLSEVSTLDKIPFILKENNNGKMDYRYTFWNALKNPKSNTMYVIKDPMSGSYYGHDEGNLGNFLFAVGAKTLGFGRYPIILGAHLNEISTGFDSWDDQRSINLGATLYNYYKNGITYNR
ncbi:MAG: hypothetical protein IPO21_00305 [Bacteroidales bacterium]|nr:hypothetical protein [Bacteroidales bacterium]